MYSMFVIAYNEEREYGGISDYTIWNVPL
jgi:hypothetical protein